MTDRTLRELADVIVAHDPVLAGSAFRLADSGWENSTVLVDDRLVFRFPRTAEAAAILEREAHVLAAVRPAVALAVPDLQLVRVPQLFSRHPMIPGGLMLAADYATLPEAPRTRLAEDLARFFAELHAFAPAAMRAAGATATKPWPSPEEVARRALPFLADGGRAAAEATIAAWVGLGPDPLGEVFGHFDAHGWNMAFDHEAGRLNGVFDFGAAGIGPLHEEFVQPSQVSPDLTRRVLRAYGRLTGRAVEPSRVGVLTGAFRLAELALHADEPDKAEPMLANVLAWLGGPGAEAGSRGPAGPLGAEDNP